MHDLLDALKFCKSVLEANPVELSEHSGPIWMAIEKAEAAMQKAEKFK